MLQLNRSVKPAAVALAMATIGIGGPSRAQTPEPSVATVVERAGRYVQEFEKEFSAVVCEEQQVQKLVRPDGTKHKDRELRSDFLLVKTGGEWMQAFRDVIEVDGKPVRNRQDRLRKLFLEAPKTAVAQAKAIASESSRYNIGVSRTVATSPILPLRFLDPRLASRFRFALSGSSLTFEEIHSPSLIGHQSGRARHDMPSHGSFVIDTESGRVLAADLTAAGAPPAFTTTFVIRYTEDPVLKLLVPVEMQERYWQPHKPGDDHLEVTSKYSNFRRFQVTVDEQIKVPK
jgi:hypothetical protein